MYRLKQIFAVIVALILIQGCSWIWKQPYTVVPDYEKKGVRLIAVLPVNVKSGNLKAGTMFREMIVNELYFKGYPKVSPLTIDEKLARVYKDGRNSSRVSIPPKTVGDLLGVDAVMYASLDECSTDFSFVYAPTHVSASFELRSAKTGETLWTFRNKTTKRNYGISREQLEIESCQIYEPSIQEIVDKAMGTLPDGPDAT